MFSKGVTLSAFIGGLVAALTQAQQFIALSRQQQIEKHFTLGDDAIYRPVTHDFQISETQTLAIPTYLLGRVNNVGIDGALIKCSAKIVDVHDVPVDCPLTDNSTQAEYIVKPATNGDFSIDIRFTRKNDCEAESLLAEYLQRDIETDN